MKITEKNIKLVMDIVLESMEDDKGRGEFDSETDLLHAVEIVIGWIEDNDNINYDKEE